MGWSPIKGLCPGQTSRSVGTLTGSFAPDSPHDFRELRSCGVTRVPDGPRSNVCRVCLVGPGTDTTGGSTPRGLGPVPFTPGVVQQEEPVGIRRTGPCPRADEGRYGHSRQIIHPSSGRGRWGGTPLGICADR